MDTFIYFRRAKIGMDRRRFLGIGAGALAGPVAGCTGENTASEGETTTAASETDAETAAEATSSPESYSVSMEPVGEVTFDSVPQAWVTYTGGYADMGVALGVGSRLKAVANAPRFHTRYYEELDGVSLDKSRLTDILGENGIDKEVFYEFDADVHAMDPNWLTNNSFFGLERSDIDDIRKNVGPFVGNTIFRRTDPWHDYRYYTMYEAFEKVARVFQRQDRFEAFRSFHDEFVADVREKLPAEGERPNALLMYAANDEPEKFSPYRVSDQGTNKKQFRDLGIRDALEGTGVEGLSTDDRGQIDHETLLEVDPDSLLVRGHEDKTREEFRSTVLAFMEDHDVASQLTAVDEGLVFRGGPIYEGPIQNLFLTERFATLYFPDSFSGELFDRGRVASIVRGEG